ncbi:MAG: hypothetical protein ABIR37_00925 [Candidatus Saccharimonadales bacterium]
MPGFLTTPVDILTGVPLPLMPVEGLPPVPQDKQINRERVADWHHPFHPRSQFLHAGAGMTALRNSRVQWAYYEHHHDEFPGYHSIYRGPDLPETEYEQFRTVVFATAGYIPRKGLAFTESGERQVELTEEQRAWLWKSGQIKIDKPIPVRDFLIDYTMSRNFVDTTGSIVDELVNSTNSTHKEQLCNRLLRIAAYEAAAELNTSYSHAKRAELLPQNAARCAGQFVMKVMATDTARKYAQRALIERVTPAA